MRHLAELGETGHEAEDEVPIVRTERADAHGDGILRE
jgi:hypothetical protein